MKYIAVWLSGIVLLGALIRLAHLGEVPAGINNDEVSHGYNAYSILTTGKDEWGRSWPITSFAAFGDYKPPVYVYLTALAVRAFGLSQYSTRLVSALAGIAAIPFVFLLVRKLFEMQPALWASLFLAISPFHIFVSRKAAEHNLAVTFVIAALYTFLKGQERFVWVLVSMTLFLLAAFTYTPARGFVLLMVTALMLLYGRRLIRLYPWGRICIALSLFLIPALAVFVSWEGRARLYQSTAYVTRGLYSGLSETQGACLSYTYSLICKIAFNKATVRAWDFIENYASHFSTRTLFVTGIRKFDAGDLRELDTYAMSGHGLFYLFGFPLFLSGLYWLVSPVTKQKGVVFAWLWLSPIPDSLTGPGHAGRMTTMIPSIEMVAALGLWQIVTFIRRLSRPWLQSMSMAVLAIVMVISSIRFLVGYRHYSDYASRAFKYGYKELFEYLATIDGKYRRVWMSSHYGEPYIYYLFFNQYEAGRIHDPSHIERTWVADDQAGTWSQVSRIDKYYFVSEVEANKVSQRDLIVNGPFGGPRDGNLLKVIRDKRGDPVFYVYESRKQYQ